MLSTLPVHSATSFEQGCMLTILSDAHAAVQVCIVRLCWGCAGKTPIIALMTTLAVRAHAPSNLPNRQVCASHVGTSCAAAAAMVTHIEHHVAVDWVFPASSRGHKTALEVHDHNTCSLVGALQAGTRQQTAAGYSTESVGSSIDRSACLRIHSTCVQSCSGCENRQVLMDHACTAELHAQTALKLQLHLLLSSACIWQQTYNC